MNTTDQRTGLAPSRRAVVRSAAWTVPVVAAATAAPAFAASPCPATTLSWAGLGNGSVFTSTTVGAVTVTLSLAGATNAANNRTISTNPTGGQNSSLRFYSTAVANSTQTVTFSFTRTSTGQPVEVQNLGFSFLDIDSSSNTNGLWSDRVSVDTGGFAYQIVDPTLVIGTGAANNRFRPAGVNTGPNNPGGSTRGNVNVSWESPLTSVSFTYSQGLAANGSPFIGISNMSFQPVIC